MNIDIVDIEYIHACESFVETTQYLKTKTQIYQVHVLDRGQHQSENIAYSRTQRNITITFIAKGEKVR